MERHVVASFLYPFRAGGRLSRWLLGMVLVALLPVSFPLVFGQAVACVRTAAGDPAAAPPPWRPCARLLADGLWTGLQAAVLTAPFVALAWLLWGPLDGVLHPTGDAFVDGALVAILAITAAAFPWGVVLLMVLPPTLAHFAISGRARDLADPRLVIVCVRGRYAEWNMVLVGITTAWALAAASLGFAGVGVVAGAFYAILVSAHACSALSRDPSAG